MTPTGPARSPRSATGSRARSRSGSSRPPEVVEEAAPSAGRGGRARFRWSRRSLCDRYETTGTHPLPDRHSLLHDVRRERGDVGAALGEVVVLLLERALADRQRLAQHPVPPLGIEAESPPDGQRLGGLLAGDEEMAQPG